MSDNNFTIICGKTAITYTKIGVNLRLCLENLNGAHGPLYKEQPIYSPYVNVHVLSPTVAILTQSAKTIFHRELKNLTPLKLHLPQTTRDLNRPLEQTAYIIRREKPDTLCLAFASEVNSDDPAILPINVLSPREYAETSVKLVRGYFVPVLARGIAAARMAVG